MTTNIKEHPILFSGPMIRAILEGRKTQTRRIIKESFNGCLTNGGPHPCPNDPVIVQPGQVLKSPINGEPDIVVDWTERVEAIFHCSTLDSVARCPYGKPGDRLWVRESFFLDGANIAYRADHEGYAPKGTPWKPSIHMSRAASRILLEITEVRVERLHEIENGDAVQEGVEWIGGGHGYKRYFGNDMHSIVHPAESFKTLWQSINGPESWNANPWVWAITFKRI